MEEIRTKTEATLAPLRVRSCCCGLTDIDKGARYLAIISIVLYLLCFCIYVADGKAGPAVFSALHLGLSAMLYYGVVKRRVKLTLAWLGAMLLLMLANIIGIVAVLAIRGEGTLFRVTYYVLNTVLTFYFWMVVFSFYMEIREEKIASRAKATATQEA